jgi:hypothetical protein
MQSKLFTASVLILSFIFIACNDRAAVEKAAQATMTIHDDAMRLIGPMQVLNRQLKAEMATLDSLSPRFDSLAQAVLAIGRADRDMMAWMANYEEPAESVQEPIALQYLKEQQSKIEQNYKDIQQATSEAKRLLETKK